MNVARAASIDPGVRILACLAVVAIAACAAPAPAPHYTFVMPVPSAAPAPGPGEPAVAVIGQVTRPGRIRFHAGLTLVGAVVDAGGFTPLAGRWHITVTRGRTRLAIPFSPIVDGRAPDPPLQPGDVVFVPESDI